MNKREVIFAAVGTVAGGAIGFAIGYKALKKNVEKDSREELDREMKQVVDLENKLNEMIKKQETETEDDIPEEVFNEYHDLVQEENVEVDPSVDDICEEIEIVDTPPVKHRKPRVLKKDDTEKMPDFYKEDIYYYMNSELLLDADGHVLNETDTIGNDLRRYGFLQGQGTADEVTVRNYDLETDFTVKRRACTPEDDNFVFVEDSDELDE